eukprot:SAG11_NODE_27057_length_337_cov_1.130252_1_plen_35_part_10
MNRLCWHLINIDGRYFEYNNEGSMKMEISKEDSTE